MAFENWKKKKVISPNSIHVPKYYGLDASLGFFCECGFVGSFSIPHDANALEAKHHDTFYNPFKMDSKSSSYIFQLTCSRTMWS